MALSVITYAIQGISQLAFNAISTRVTYPNPAGEYIKRYEEAVQRINSASKGGESACTKDAFQEHLWRVEEELQKAREATKCRKCIADVDSIIKTLAEKRKEWEVNNKIIDILEERGLDSWLKLDEKMKKEIIEEAKNRCRGEK